MRMLIVSVTNAKYKLFKNLLPEGEVLWCTPSQFPTTRQVYDVVYNSSPTTDKSALEEMHALVLNRNVESMKVCNNKWRCYERLQTIEVPQIPTSKTKDYPFPYVMKSIYGERGKSVYIIHNEEEAVKAERAFARKHIDPSRIIYQPYIEGQDVFCYMLGGKVIASAIYNKHIGTQTDFWSGVPYVLSKEEELLCEKIAEELKLDMFCIQFLKSKDGLQVCECNSNPAMGTSVEFCTKVSVPTKILEYIESKLNNQ